MSNLMDHVAGRQLMLAVAECLDVLRIPYFLMQGTALGAYRDHGFTPTERDIDLGLLQEHLSPYAAMGLISLLLGRGFDIEAFVKPLQYVRTIVVWGHEAKLDIVGFSKYEGQRFTLVPVRPWITEPYALVHDAKLLETYESIELWGRPWNMPHPIEEYLVREYGPSWNVPQDDHVSRTRDYDRYDHLVASAQLEPVAR